MDSDR